MTTDKAFMTGFLTGRLHNHPGNPTQPILKR
jgi:hypothetical protein